MARPTFPVTKVPALLTEEYYLKRGISKETIDACGIKAGTRQQCLDSIKSTRRTNFDAGLIIPYDKEYNYCTIRWVGDNLSTFGTRLRDDPKLLAPQGDLQTYIPPITDEENFDGDLYLCESAFKALALAQHGYYAVAGNGVDGLFTSKGMTFGFPRWLFDVQQVERVYILFDSDWATNKRVNGAIRRQTIGLRDEFGTDFDIIHKQLDKEGEDHWGIDDAIAARGIEWLREWLGGDEDQAPVLVDDLYRHYEELNTQYTVCKVPHVIIDKDIGGMYPKTAFTDMIESGRTFMDRVNGRWKEISPAKEWLKWSDHNVVTRLAYLPGCSQVGEDSKGSYYNTWTDCGVEAKTGCDIKPFLDVYKNAIPDTEVRQLLLESLAWMIQNRDSKLDKAFLLIGGQVGTGKSLLVQIMGEIVGYKNYSSIGVEDFTSSFNSPFTSKEIILMDDVVKMPKAVAGKFRRYVTDKTILVNTKGLVQYDVDNQAVWFLTANKYRALPMDENERRVLVVDFTPVRHYPTGHEWWNKFISWLEHGGYGIIRAWLEELDISGYDPNFMPPMNEAKLKVQEATRTSEEQFVIDLWYNPEEVLGSNVERSVFTTKELWSIYTGPDGDSYSTNRGQGLGGALKESQFTQANDRKVIRHGNESSRFWVIRGRDLIWDSRNVRDDVKANPDVTPGGKGKY